MTAPTRPVSRDGGADNVPALPPLPPPPPKTDDNRWLHAATRRIQDAA